MSRKTVHPLLLVAALLLAGLARSAGATVSDSLTVDECVALARRLAPGVRAAALDRGVARGDSAAAAVAARPTVAAVAGAVVAPQGFYDPVITNLGDYQLQLSMEWTALDGGRLERARRRGGLDLRAADERAALETRDAGLEAARLAIQLLRLQEEVAAQQLTIEWLGRLADLVRAGVSMGSRGPSDSARVDLELDAAVTALESARLDARTTALALGTLLGRPDSDSLAVRGSSPLADRGPSAADSTRLLAVVERAPEVLLARTLAARSRLDLMDAQRVKSPTVTVSIDAGLLGADLTHLVPPDLLEQQPDATFADRLRRDLGASAAVHLRLPVADATAGPGVRAREAAVKAQEVRGGAEATRQRQETLALLARWSAAFRRVEAERHTRERAEDNLLRVKSLYSAGGTRLLDLLDARRVYEESRQRLADARAENRSLRFEAEDRR